MNSASHSMPQMAPQDRCAKDLSVSEIDEALHQNSLWRIALPGVLEQRFRIDALESRFRLLQRSGWLALLIFDCFLLVDWLMTPDVFAYSVLIRLGIFTPLGVVTLLSASRVQSIVISRQLTEFVDWVTVLSGWTAGFCLALILFKSHSALAIYYHAGFMVVIIYGILVQSVSFKAAVLYGMGLLMMHLWSINEGQALPDSLRLSLLHLLVSTVGLSLGANYFVEKARRRRYLLLLRERLLSDRLGHVNQQLQYLSQSDVLTGVANRRHFHDHLAQVWARADMDQSPVSVLMLDVDHFKAYNDRYGHPAGDACLRQVAQAMAAHLRQPIDFIARYGGEEFIAVLPEADAQVARHVAERVRQGIQDLALPHEGSSTLPVVTASIGVATVVPGQADASAEKLVSWADRALYEAKRQSRNQVRVHEPPA